LPWPRVYHPFLTIFGAVRLLLQQETGKEIQSMTVLIAIFFMRLFEVMFLAGVAGSAVVVVISFIEDIQLLVGD
jgi:hypothetical protein